MKKFLSLCAGAALVFSAAACSGATSSGTSDSSAPACPAAAIPITVSVNQWGNIVSQLAGQCGTVSTVVTASSGDPHDYEPTTGDIAEFTNAKLVVINGVGYDEWATKAVSANNSGVEVVSAATVNDVQAGANPHLWYNPEYVTAMSKAITDQLKQLVPNASTYFDDQQSAFQTAMKPYFAEIAKIKAGASGKTYGATESVFDYMAQACGLKNLTPQGYQNSITNESEPAPGDIAAFNKDLSSKQMNVLIFNTQTEGSVPNQLVATAKTAAVPVVNVTETMPEGSASFEQWQISQLEQLATALGLG
ncbi:MAG: zinc ABC transporter substrate-binding protein [Actinobacteria bacterium]|nr:zinc ABC transporter substrate-binding protein [Actinomycetota bacterium]